MKLLISLFILAAIPVLSSESNIKEYLINNDQSNKEVIYEMPLGEEADNDRRNLLTLKMWFSYVFANDSTLQISRILPHGKKKESKAYSLKGNRIDFTRMYRLSDDESDTTWIKVTEDVSAANKDSQVFPYVYSYEDAGGTRLRCQGSVSYEFVRDTVIREIKDDFMIVTDKQSLTMSRINDPGDVPLNGTIQTHELKEISIYRFRKGLFGFQMRSVNMVGLEVYTADIGGAELIERHKEKMDSMMKAIPPRSNLKFDVDAGVRLGDSEEPSSTGVLDDELLGAWEGSESDQQRDGMAKSWVVTRYEDGGYRVDFRITENGQTKSHTEYGDWWIDDGLYHSYHPASESLDIYEYEFLDENTIQFTSTEKLKSSDKEVYRFTVKRVR